MEGSNSKNSNTVDSFFFLSTEINSPQYLIDRPHFCFLNSSDFSSKSEMLTVSVSC